MAKTLKIPGKAADDEEKVEDLPSALDPAQRCGGASQDEESVNLKNLHYRFYQRASREVLMVLSVS